ncbi:MAG: hypothetical protein Q9221_002385 [Calogaya cf. arnoldii]
MWNRILGKSSEPDRKSSTSESQRKSDSQRSTPRRSDSQKSTTSSRKTTRSEEHDRGFNPTSTSYSSTTQNRYPGTASASVASSYETAFNDPTDESYSLPGLVRNASLADKIPKTLSNDGQRAVALDSGSKSEKDKEDSATMEEILRRKERRGTREKDEDRRESKSHRDKKRRNSGKGSERAMSTDDVSYSTSQRGGDRLPIASSGVSGSSFVGQHDPRLDHTDDRPRAQSSHIQDQFPGQFPSQSTTPYRPPLAAGEYTNVQPHAQSSHVQDQFPGQFPAQSATPYWPPLAASEGGPGLAAEYYGDAGQSVIDQPGVRIHSPSLIVGAEPHLQAASVVAAPPPEPSVSGGIGAAASFFDGTFSAGSDMEGHPSQKPATTNVSYSSAAPSISTYTTSGTRPSAQQSTSAPMIPTIGSAAAGAVAGYYIGNHSSKPAQPGQSTSSTAGHGKMSGPVSHHQSSETHGSYTSHPYSNRPTTKPGKHSSQSSNIPLYAAGAAGAAAAAYHHNHSGSTHNASSHHGSSHHGPVHHESTHHTSNGQYYAGSSIAQQHKHRYQGPFSKLVDFFKDPDGVAQFEEYTEYIGVCRHCFDPRSSPRDAPRKHHYRRRCSDERLGSNLRVDKDHRYSSSESESRRRKKNRSWLGAGIAGYGLGKMGENLFLHDNDSRESHRASHDKASKTRRRRSSSSSERKSRTSYGVVNRSSDTLSRRGRSKDRVETGITGDGKIYRKDSHGNIDTLKVKTDASHGRSRSRSRDRRSNAPNTALGAALGSSLVASHSRRRSKSPKKAFVRAKHGRKESSSELASILKLNESDPRDSRHASRHSPESQHGKGRRKEKKSRGFFSFRNSSSSSSTSSDQVFGVGHDQKKPGRTAKPKRKGKESRDAEAALLGLGAAALAFNQSQRPKRKSELIAVKETKGKQKAGKHRHKGKRSSSSSEEDPWESASEGEYSSADSELAYGGSLHRRSQESLSSESSGLDKWDWRWGSKKQNKKTPKDRRHLPTFDETGPGAVTAPMMTGARQSPPSLQNQDSRMTSSSSIALQHVYPMPTSDPTQFDVARHDAEAPSYQPYMSARPDPVPIQHPQPVAPVSPAVYTSQAPYTHSNSAPVGLSSTPRYAHSSSSAPNYITNFTDTRNDLPGAFPTADEGFGSFMQDPKRDPKPRRRDSSPVIDTSEYITSSVGPRRRKSLKDDNSSVRFDLTKEQEDKDRRDERRRRKEEEERRERLERRESEERKDSDRDTRAKPNFDSTQSAIPPSRKSGDGIRREPWAAPAAAGVIAAAIGATVAAGTSSNVQFDEERHSDHGERDVEVIVRERPASNQVKHSSEGRGRTSQKTGMSVWQAAAKVKRTPNHTGYAAYFTPTELLSKEPSVKETVGANADNDITVYQVPNMITIQPSEPSGHSPSRAYSFPITAEDVEHSVKPLPWAVPQLNLVEATPPVSRSGSVVGDRSPRIRSSLSKEIHDIPLEPLESVSTPDLPDLSSDQPAHVEYTVIEPKGQSTTDLVDSPVSDRDVPESVPGISSLKKKQKPRENSPSHVDYGDDLDFTATVAAGLQDTGFNPAIVVDDPSFRRRDSPPGSEDDEYRRRPFTTVTEITSEPPAPRSPPHGFVEEIEEPHMPGSFDEDEERASPSEDIRSTRYFQERSRSPQELTGPSDNANRSPNVYSTEEDAFKPEDVTNAAIDPVGARPYGQSEQVKRGAAAEDATEPSNNAGVKPKVYTTEIDAFEPQSITNAVIDPVGDRPHKRREPFKRDTANEDATEPSDNAGVKPYVYTAEPEPFEAENVQNVAIDPVPGDHQSGTSLDEILRSSPQDQSNTNDNADYLSDDTPSVAASAPVPSSRRKDSKSNKKSKRRSVGFDDDTSVISSPATYGGKQDSTSPSKAARKGGIFGLFSKSTENLPESKGIQQTPVEASLEDFEEPRERKKKSKSRRSDRADEDIPPASTESVVTSQPEAQDDWDTPKKSKRGKEKRRSSGDPGRITQDLPAQVIPPASSGHRPFPTSDKMLTSLEDHEPGHSQKGSGSDVTSNEIAEPSRIHDNQQPSFLGERPEKPPLPDTPDASEDPGGQRDLQRVALSEQDLQSPADQRESRIAKTERPIRSVPDLQSDGRSVSYSSPSPTAIPLRPLRFGRRPSSPGFAKSLPSTPQPSTTAELPFTPRRRERPHSTEFKSNEFRPMWLLEKYGSRQEPTPQESYPSLPSSHSTSRASSVHESDDLYRTEALNLAQDEANYRRLIQEPRGLSIDTSHHEKDPELLGSQQATPTAASFQSMVNEGDSPALEAAREGPSESQKPNPESIDVILSASTYHDPLADLPQDQRLLHGVEDLFPQCRSSSPSRYNAGIEAGIVDQSVPGAYLPVSTLQDAPLSALAGGSAAALLKSTSQHEESLEQVTTPTIREQVPKSEENLAPKQNDNVPGRPTAEETRMMQEQDAQDAVDSWFAPAQPKRPKLDKKGRKRGKSYEEQATPSNEPSTQLDEHQDSPISQEQSGSILEDAALATDLRETNTLDTVRDESTVTPANANYQAALSSRKDSKGKKKKNKKKASDPWGETPVETPGAISEEPLDTEPTVRQSSVFTDRSITEPFFTEPVTLQESPHVLAERETFPSNEAANTPTEVEASFAPAKKNKKGKKKNRSQSLVDPEQDQPQDKSLAASEPAEAVNSKDLEIPVGQPDVPLVEKLEESQPRESLSEEVPYAFPPSEEPKIQEPTDSLHPTDRPLAREPLTGYEPSAITDDVSFGVPIVADLEEREPSRSLTEEVPYEFPPTEETKIEGSADSLQPEDEPVTMASSTGIEPNFTSDEPFDKSLEDRLSEVSFVSAAKSLAKEGDTTPDQQPEILDKISRVSPKTIPLPPDDDLDLLDALPESPVLQPVDASITGKQQYSEDQDASVQEPIIVGDILDRPSVKALSVEPTVLSKAISELDLPQSAAAAYDIEKDESDTLVLSSNKKSKKDKKRKKNKGSQPPAFEIGGPAEETVSAVSASPLPEVGDGDSTIIDPTPKHDNPSFTVSAFTGDLGSLPEEAVGTVQEQPENEWPDFSILKAKKGRKGRKAKLIGEESEQTDPNSSIAIAYKGTSAEDPITTSSAMPVTDVPAEDSQQVDSVVSAPSKAEPFEVLKKTTTPAIEEGDEWPSVSKIKKKGKKSKGVQFTDFSGSQPEEPKAVDIPEKPVAATSTAIEVQDLLHGPEPEASRDVGQEGGLEVTPVASLEEYPVSPGEQTPAIAPPENDPEKFNKTQLPEPYSPISFTQASPSEPVEDHQIGLEERMPAASPVLGVSAEMTANTETAAEVQEMLSKAEEPETTQTLVEATISDREQTAEADDFAWAPLKKKKKSKKSKKGEDASTPDLQKGEDLPVDSGTPVAGDLTQDEPVEGISAKKSKKDKESKRQALTRSASNVGQDETHIDVPSAVEEAHEVGMTMMDNAPSLLEKTDQLPSLEVPKSPEVQQPILEPVEPSKPEIITAAGELDAPAMTRDVDFKPNADIPKPFTDIEESSQLPQVEEMAMSADAPSVLEKHNELPSIERLFSQDSEAALIDRDIVTLDATAVQAHDTNEAPQHDRVSSTADPEDITLAVEKLPKGTGTPAISVPHDEPLSELPKDEPDHGAEGDTPAIDEITSADLAPLFETREKSKKDKKKGKKTKVAAWEDDSPTVGEFSTEPNEAQERPIDRDIKQPTGDIALDTEAMDAQVFPVSEKERKKGKKAKQSAWEDDNPEASTGAIEPTAELIEAEHEQPFEAVIDDAPAMTEEPTQSKKEKKDKKKSKKSKALAWEEDEEPSLEPAAESFQIIVPLQENESVGEPSAEPAEQSVETTLETPGSKKGKKKGKKSKFVAWDEDESTVPIPDEPQQQAEALPEAEVIGEDPEVSVEAAADGIPGVVEEQPLAKKSKKKGKKSKLVDFDEEASLPPSRDEEALLAPTPLETEANLEVSKDIQQPEIVEDVPDVPKEPASSKRGKKGKKPKFVDFTEDSPIVSAADETNTRDPILTEHEAVAEIPQDVNKQTKLEEESFGSFDQQSYKKGKTSKKSKLVDSTEDSPIVSAAGETRSRDPVLTEPEVVAKVPEEVLEQTKLEEESIGLFEQQSSKKGKKKSKKSKYVDWEEEPTIPSPRDEIDQQEPIPIENEVAKERIKDIQMPSEERDTVLPTDDSSVPKKGKKKGKKSKFMDWDEEPSIPLSKDEGAQQEPISTESELASEVIEDVQRPPEESETVLPSSESPMAKEKQKKSRKSKFVAWDDEPSVPSVEDDAAASLGDEPREVDQTSLEIPAEDDGALQTKEELEVTLVKSKKEKKKAKKAKAFSWDEEPSPAFEEPPVTDTDNLPRDFNDPISKTENEMTGNVYEAVPADQTEAQAQTAILETGEIQTVSPILPEAQPSDDNDILRDAPLEPLEPVEISTAGEQNVPTLSREATPEPYYGSPERSSSEPPISIPTAEPNPVQNLAEEQAQPGPHPEVDHVVEDVGNAASNVPVRDASPLLLQVEDVHVGPEPIPSLDDALKAAEVSIPPTPPDEKDTDLVPPTADIANEPLDSIIIPSALDIPESAHEQEVAPSQQLVDRDPDVSADVPIDPAEPLQALEAGADDVAEEFALVDKKGKKKSKKPKKAMAFEDEVMADVHDEDATIGERNKEADTASDQPAPLPTTISEQALEDSLVVSRKDKKKAKKKNKAFPFDDESSESTAPVELEPGTDVVDQTTEVPPLPAQPTVTDEAADLRPPSKKDKRKGKQSKKTFDPYDEPSSSTPQAEADFERHVVDQTVEDLSLPTEPSISEDFGSTSLSKKDRKKSKKTRTTFDFDEEPSVDTTPTEPWLGETPTGRIEETTLPTEPILGTADDDFPDQGKKEKKKSKNNTKAFSFDQEPEEDTTPAELTIDESIAEQVEEPSSSTVPDVTVAEEEFPDPNRVVKKSKKDKKGKKAFTFDDEPSGNITITEPDGLDKDPLVVQPSMATEGSVAEAPEGFFAAPYKKDKKSKKNKKALAFDDEPPKIDQPPMATELSMAEDVPTTSSKKEKKSKKSKKARTFDDEFPESATPAEPGNLEKDISVEPTAPTDATDAEAYEDFSTAPSKKGKKNKKKQVFAFEDELPESAPPEEPETFQRDISADQPPLSTEASIADPFEDFSAESNKKNKKNKKKQKAVAFEDDSLPDTPMEPVDRAMEELTIPAEPTANEAVDDFESLSKKDRKKAKKGKKAFVFDEPIESPTPPESSVPVEPTEVDIPVEFLPDSKKDKKKTKKSKKPLAWEEETPETGPMVEEVATLDETPQEISAVPSVPALQQGEEAETSPQVASPIIPAQPDDPHSMLEGQPKEETSIPAATPEFEKSADIATPEREVVPGVDEANLFATSKKSKKDKKKAKKSQAFSWGDDEDTSQSPLPDIATSANDLPATLPEIQEGQVLRSVDEIADLGASPSILEATEQQPEYVPLIASPPVELVEQVRAPRHQDPTQSTPADIAAPSESTPSPSPEKPLEQQSNVSIEPTAEDSVSKIAVRSTGPVEEAAQATARETSLNTDDGFNAFAPTTKSKKGKKGKKQVIDWEDEIIPPPEPASGSTKAVGDIDTASRPEMAAWPTEVRLNQTLAPLDPEEPPTSPVAIVDDPTVAEDQFLVDEPQEPAPVEDDRSDYFGQLPSRDLPNQPQPFEDDALYAQPSPAPLPSNEGTRSRTEGPGMDGDDPVDISQEQADLSAPVAEQPHQGVVAGPVDDFEGIATTKKEKKAKRKKKQALDDVMWEFPSVPPTAEVTPVESKWPSDPSRGDRLYREPATILTGEEQNLVDSERITQGEYAETGPAEPTGEGPIDTQRQVGIQSDTSKTEQPRNEEAVDEDWGAVSKKAKKGKISKKSKATEYFEKPELDTQQAPQTFEEMEHPSRTDKRSPSPGVDTVEAIAAAAAVSAGLATAQGLTRKASKKDKKKKKAQASNTWTEPDLDLNPKNEAPIEDPGSTSQNRVPTPERRSPIQAWHQNISPTQSPRHSELYGVEDERPRSAASFRRKRSYDNERRQSLSAERRSPISAWHQYDTSGHSPMQSELYDYDRSEARDTNRPPSTSAFNRDSAVHVADSPIVSHHSPVRRAMRDSGYPDTEASPIISQGAEKQERVQGVSQDLGQDDGESIRANPLQILSEDVPKGRQQKKRTRSRSPSRREDDDADIDLPPMRPRPRSFDEVREPSPVSSTTKDRSSVLFQSSPLTREEQQRSTQAQGSPPRGYHNDQGEQVSHPTERSLTPPREDNSAMVNARAESLAALSGLRQSNQEQQGTSLFGGPIDVGGHGTSSETPIDQDGVDRRRLKTITEYSPEESPLHKKNRDLSDVGISAHGVKSARRSGTPLAIAKRRARSPLAESGAESTATEDAAPGPFWPATSEDKQAVDAERSQSRGMEQRPSSHQSNISSLVSGPPKQREYERRSFSGASNHSVESINAFIRTPPEQMRSASGMSNRSSGTPPLRRVDRSVSSDLRSANRKSEAHRRAKQPEPSEAEPEVDTSISVPVPVPSTPSNDSTKNKSKGRVKGMADVFEGYGDFHGSPLSPTRPPSVRRRQSMQVLELESKNDRLTAENRQLHEAKLRAERDFQDATHDREQEIASYREGIETRETWLHRKDAELSQLKETIENLQAQVAQLEEVNQELHASSRGLDDHQEQHSRLEQEHAATHQQWQQSTRELEDLRQQHAQLSAGMEDIVRHEVTTALESKNLELHRLQSDLSSAQSQIRTLQAQILASKHTTPSSDSLLSRDEDYFDTLCQSLCNHVQQWVLRFSKFSDSRACYLASEIRDEKIVDRMENAILDGSDVDTYLADRVKRRDVFMSMVMTMTWEYIFTRYLFGADREQRQKLKSLEKTLSESPSNSRQAIHKWRATTLHLLSKREQFIKQRVIDTEAVTHTIYTTLATILPPPSHLVPQIQSSLTKVLTLAVDLSIEMRTQRFEYVMLPPLQPEYDTNGDLARKVFFNKALMNARGEEGRGEGLERMEAVVRMVLFPLVVRKGEGGGEGDQVEEIVVCPALVLCADEEGRNGGRRGVSRGGSVEVGMGGMF